MFSNLQVFFRKYERWISPVTVVIGFIFDNLTLRRIDVFFSNALLIFYLVVSALSILLLNIHEHRRGEAERSETLHFILIFAMQFCLGGLFSASFLFYSKSGTLIDSWPFLLMIAGYIVGNEILRKNYVRLSFQVAVFFTALFSYLIFFLPVILGIMGDAIFILSGVSSLMITGLFIYILSWFAPERTRRSTPIIIGALSGLFAIINILYFTNLIPPIPLALKDAGIYRSVNKIAEGSYVVSGENQQWFNVFSRKPIIHMIPGEPLYALSLIFAPTKLSTDIVHVWQYFDDGEGRWISFNPILLRIGGGREGGFRTYSMKENVFPGLWRVDVRTPRGQIIGRLSFKIALSMGEEEIVTLIK
jgi:MFS family permease